MLSLFDFSFIFNLETCTQVVSKETSPLKRAERKEDAAPSDPDAADAAETTAPENYDPFDFFDLNWSTRNKRETIYEVPLPVSFIS